MLDAIPFDSFGEFLNMGGYAFNVWTVYLLFVIFVLVNLLGPLRRKKKIMLQLRRRQSLETSGTDTPKPQSIDEKDGLSSKPTPGESA